MDDASTILFLLLAVGLGYTLFMAAREFASDVRAAKLEHALRAAASERAPPSAGADTGDAGGPRDGSASGETGRRKRAEGEGPPRPMAWHEVLGVPPGASLDEIKTAYRRRIALYHPDRVAGLGTELRDLAEAHAKEINAAYALACGQRDAR